MLTGWEAAQVHMSKSVIAVYHSNCECNISLAGAGAAPLLSHMYSGHVFSTSSAIATGNKNT